jgi:hypothetical protein
VDRLLNIEPPEEPFGETVVCGFGVTPGSLLVSGTFVVFDRVNPLSLDPHAASPMEVETSAAQNNCLFM